MEIYLINLAYENIIMLNFVTRLFKRLKESLYAIYPKLYKLRYGSKLILGKNVLFKGLPLIHVCNEATISIGDNVILNSLNNKDYHVLLHSRVKLIADREGAMIEIGDSTRIHGSCIHAYKKVSIGRKCLIGANCNIIDGNGHDLAFDNVEGRHKTKGGAKDVIIENCVWIGANSILLPGTHVGYGSVVSAGSVVRGEVLSFCLAAGNPAKVVKRHKL